MLRSISSKTLSKQSLKALFSTEVLRKTPLHAIHVENGANMTGFGGWDMPLYYKEGWFLFLVFLNLTQLAIEYVLTFSIQQFLHQLCNKHLYLSFVLIYRSRL